MINNDTTAPSADYAIVSFEPTLHSGDTLQTFVTTSERALLERQLHTLMQDLERYERYPANWDSYGGACFSEELTDQVYRYAKRLCTVFEAEGTTPDLFEPGPAGDGSIDIELRLGTRAALFTFYPNNNIRGLGQQSSGEHAEHVKPNDSFPLEAWTAWLTGTGMLPTTEVES